MFSEIKVLNSLHDMESAMKHDENLNKIVQKFLIQLFQETLKK